MVGLLLAGQAAFHPAVAVTGGFGDAFLYSQARCLVPAAPCNSARPGDGPAFTLAAQVLYGGFVQGGLRLGATVIVPVDPSADEGTLVAGNVLVVGRVGSWLFGDLAAGATYGSVIRSNPRGARETSGTGFVASATLGYAFADAVAAIVRFDLSVAPGSAQVITGGLEWRPGPWTRR